MLSTADLVVFPGDLRFLLCFFIECDPSTPGHGSFTSGSPISGTTTACNEQLSVKASTILLRSKVRNPPLSVCDDVLSLQACTYAYVHSLMHSLTLNLDFNSWASSGIPSGIMQHEADLPHTHVDLVGLVDLVTQNPIQVV